MVGKRGESCNALASLSRVNPARGRLMRSRLVSLVLMIVCVVAITSASHVAAGSLPLEPDVTTGSKNCFVVNWGFIWFFFPLKVNARVDYLPGPLLRDNAGAKSAIRFF